MPIHHRAPSLTLAEAVELVERVRVSAQVHAQLGLDALARDVSVPIVGIALRTCPPLPPTLAEQLRDPRAQNVADWVMYRMALARAAEARGWLVHAYDAKAVIEVACHALRIESLDARFAQARNLLGPPWNMDHKLAMAAAIAAAASECASGAHARPRSSERGRSTARDSSNVTVEASMKSSKTRSDRTVARAAKTSKSTKRPAPRAKASAASGAKTGAARKARKPASLPKSDGDAGVRAYIASLEPWQAAIARRVDALVVKHAPGVRKAMRWHCPFYGIEGQGWFLAFAAFQRHVKFTFFKGASLRPVPPVGKVKDVRSLDVREADELDEKQLASWIEQAASIPGWDGGSPRRGGSAL